MEWSTSAIRRATLALLLGVPLPGCGDPFTVEGPATCEIPDQNDYVFRQMAHSYFWNATMPESIDPTAFDDPTDVARELRHDELDRWSYVADKGKANAYFEEGKFIGHGFNRRWESATGSWRIARVHHNSPSSEAGLARGDIILAINGIGTATLDAEGTWNTELGPSEPDIEITMNFFDYSEGVEREEVMIKDWISIVTVPTTEVIDYGDHVVGYLAFETFVQTAAEELNAAYDEFKAAGVTDLVIDLRYNSGGSISIAGHIIDLTVGGLAEKEIAYQYLFNDDLSNQELVTKVERLSQSIAPRSVTFINTGTTVSASELVINSLRPHVPVYMVGSTTGGKPVGSRGFDFCDHKLFAVMFEMVNAEGEGRYFDGMTPDCPAGDDFNHLRGDPLEDMFAEALTLLDTGACSPGAFVVDPDDTATRFGAQQRPTPGLRTTIGWE